MNNSTLVHLINARIDNVTNCPTKPSDLAAYQLGFRHCFEQIIATINESNTLHAVALGSIKSEKKAAAARENGKKGGAPRKKPLTT